MAGLCKVAAILLSLITLSTACLGPDDFLYEQHLVRNGTQEPLAKRWYRNRPASGQSWWNSAQLIYCFDPAVSSSDVSTLTNALNNGWQRWRGADTQNKITAFNFRQGTAAECSTSTNNIMTIKTNNQGIIDTQPFPPGVMKIDVSAAKKYASKIEGCMAHEIGHAFGLRHEHQRGDVFGAPIGSNQSPRVTFDCTALADWARVGKPDPTDDRCTKLAAAYRAGFSAWNFLPYTIDAANPAVPWTSTNIDYDSIMFYGGNAGSKPRIFHSRAVVILDQTTGQPFKVNSVPSQGDLDGLVTLAQFFRACGGNTKRDNACTAGSAGSPIIGEEPAECYVATVSTSISTS